MKFAGEVKRKTLAAAAALAMLVGLVCAAGAGEGAAVARAASSADVSNTAVVLNVANGASITNDDVQAVVMPTDVALAAKKAKPLAMWLVPGQDIRVLGQTVEVVVPPTKIPPRYVDGSDVVNFQVTVVAGGKTGTWQTSAQAASVDGSARWVAVDTVVYPTKASRTADRALPKAARMTISGAPKPVAAQTMRLTTTSPTRTAARKARRFITPAECQAIKLSIFYQTVHFPVVVATKIVRPWAGIGSVYPTAGDHAWFTYTHQGGHGFESSFGVAVSVEPDIMSFHASGSSKVTNSAGYGYESPHATYAQAFRTQVEYRKMIVYASPAPPPFGNGTPFSCTRPYQTLWEPIQHLGNFMPVTGLKRPHWTHCAKEGRGTWWRARGNGYEWHNGGGVQIAGVIGFNVQSNHQYSDESRIAYKQRHTEWLCGNNARPLHAGKIMESTKEL
ncbi:MAG: hypothetical protein FWE71_02890 [Nocardioidaceae bacterium]|nr:hypothetical protein [Nocardioidaceae bacterium]MCL2613719.1 hypothetical protein [Nocardioidaceae bacterium]